MILIKKILTICISALLLLTGCNAGEKKHTTGDEESLKDTSKAEKTSRVIINEAQNYFDLDSLSDLSGYDCDFEKFMPDDTLLKLMAGDSDVDIYIVDACTLRFIKEKGLYVPIESETLTKHNTSCFEYLEDCVYAENGDTAAVVLNSVMTALVYPKAVEDELGYSLQNVKTITEFSDFIKNYKGERKPYIFGYYLFQSFLNSQYTQYYCDYSKNEFDYDTELYKSIFAILYGDETGEKFYGKPYDSSNTKVADSRKYLPKEPIPFDMVYRNALSTAHYNLDNMLITDAAYRDYAAKHSELLPELRAIPFPRISEDINNNFVAENYAVINPYSKNIEGAVKVLETIIDNYDKVSFEFGTYTFIKKDVSEYGDEYQPETELFKDFFNIAENGFAVDYNANIYYYSQYWDDYFAGKLTLDEAIAEHERVINIWLNE